MNFFKKKNNPSGSSDKSRRSFISKFPAALVAAGLLAGTKDAFAVESKTGLIYVKQNGEIINHYRPSGGPQMYLGGLIFVGFPFAPPGFLQCNGQLLPIAIYDALFTLLGTIYGGDGIVTFALPDLRGRIPIHQGQGAGLQNYIIGQAAGVEEVTLTTQQMPTHNHSMPVNASTAGSQGNPSNNFIAQNADGIPAFDSTANTTLNSSSLSSVGGNQAHSNMQPYLTINILIATEGIYPSGGLE